MKSAVMKKKDKWYLGLLTGGYQFKAKKVINKLEDVKEISNYVHMKKWLENEGKLDLYHSIMSKNEAQSMYILDLPVEMTEGEWEQWWWANINGRCLICKKDCKQSDKVTIVSCDQYEEKG